VSRPVLIDTTIWIDFLRDQQCSVAPSVKELLETGRAVLANVIRAEILPYIKSEKKQREWQDYFSQFETLPFLEEFWEDVINLGSLLHRRGHSHLPLPDLMLAVLCLKNKTMLFSKDGHFKAIAEVSGLELYRP
jgi:predicted nucleic acid-binding protein